MVLLPGPVVILGDIFMSKYLSVFDRDADAVYIGKANQDSDKSMMFTDQPSDALLELDDVETDNWTEISAVSYWSERKCSSLEAIVIQSCIVQSQSESVHCFQAWKTIHTYIYTPYFLYFLVSSMLSTY